MSQTCTNCRFGRRTKRAGLGGYVYPFECRKRAPVPASKGAPWGFPLVKDDDWCAEWASQGVPKPKGRTILDILIGRRAEE